MAAQNLQQQQHKTVTHILSTGHAIAYNANNETTLFDLFLSDDMSIVVAFLSLNCHFEKDANWFDATRVRSENLFAALQPVAKAHYEGKKKATCKEISLMLYFFVMSVLSIDTICNYCCSAAEKRGEAYALAYSAFFQVVCDMATTFVRSKTIPGTTKCWFDNVHHFVSRLTEMAILMHPPSNQ